jgi:hypothetical protein
MHDISQRKTILFPYSLFGGSDDPFGFAGSWNEDGIMWSAHF